MMVQTHLDLMDMLTLRGVIKDYDNALIGAGSVDLRLGNKLLVEDIDRGGSVRLAWGESPPMRERMLSPDGTWHLLPGEFALASTVETIFMPDNMVAIVLLRSSSARGGVDHAFAGLVDPGFEGQLTLELKNNLGGSRLILEPGMVLAQIVFFEGRLVPAELSYRVRGRYSRQRGPTPSKGLLRTGDVI
jgi:dCTP deaminase